MPFLSHRICQLAGGGAITSEVIDRHHGDASPETASIAPVSALSFPLSHLS
jgi:hypothetical protein